ncbi:hypothetical protein BBEV_2872 [Salisediminibacterium beveridgei]|uniref:Uncharacterized protein n=2 Tax=Salisediminibacterium beveridgei TaxID=632773 RepID=A0A1D7QYW6_9BACI|nr:hypothetical protein BBEV_2872 [Salisediminibacterium beveridgei]
MTLHLVKLKLASSGYVLWQLMFLQGLGFIFSLNATSGHFGGTGLFEYRFEQYTPSLIFIFSLIWMMVVSGGMTLKREQKNLFSFPATRDTEATANGIMLLVYSGLGALTAMLLMFPHALVTRLILQTEGTVLVTNLSLGDYVIGLAATWFYLLLVGGIAYLIWMLFQQHVFVRIGTVAAIAILIFTPVNELTGAFFLWFTEETFLPTFLLKVLAVFLLSYGAGFLLLRRMEVIR